MAIDQNVILQLLAQSLGGGSPQIRPTSGLQEPSLSGLQLGEQGMGLGGGGSLLGGGGGLGTGGVGGPGLDFFQLMSQLQGVGGDGLAPSQNLLGGMGPSAIGFGAGGQLQPQQGAIPQGTLGQAGMGGGQSAAQALGLFKELLGLGKTLTPASQRPVTTASPTGIPGEQPVSGDLTQAFPGAGPAGQIMEGVGGGSPTQAFLGAPPSGQIMEGIGGGFPLGFSGPFTAGGGPQAISAPFLAGGGPESVGQLVGPGGGTPGILEGLGGVSGVLGGLGTLASLGTGALNLSQGNLGGGLGTLGGAALGAALAPETLGLSLLGGAGLGGGLGGLFGNLFGGLFGGGGPSVYDRERAIANQVAQGDISALSGNLRAGATPEQILAALQSPSADFSSIAGRNPVRSSLELPWNIAQQIGLPVVPPSQVPGEFTWIDPVTGQQFPHDVGDPFRDLATQGILEYGPTGQGQPRYANMAEVPWGALSPASFQSFLNLYRANPATARGYVRGSGDVGYLPQAQAEATAGQAQNLTIDALNRLMGLA